MSEPQSFTPPHPLNTAVLFLIFNRLDTTRQVFQAIRQANPPRLYIAADGPRVDRGGEADKVQSVRDYVMENIDWDCEVKTLFRDENLGCKYAVSGAISWFFENEKKGIILEDDCLPHPFFFEYCEYYLNRFLDDMSVFSISGSRFVEDDYAEVCLGRYSLMWGWATWANRWEHYTHDLHDIDQVCRAKFDKNFLVNYWKKRFNDTNAGRIDTWDYQWIFHIIKNDKLVVRPAKNLINNLGFDQNATHTLSVNKKLLKYFSNPQKFNLKHTPSYSATLDREDEKNWLGIKLHHRVQLTYPFLLPMFSFLRLLKAKMRHES